MRTIESEKIYGVKIWIDDDYDLILKRSRSGNNSSSRAIEFKSVKDIDKLIKDLKEFKKTFVERHNQ